MPIRTGRLAVVVAGFALLVVFLATTVFYLFQANDDDNDVAKAPRPGLFGGDNRPAGRSRFKMLPDIPFHAVATPERLEQIEAIQLQGTIRFMSASNENKVTITWEALKRLLYQERGPNIDMRVLLVNNHGWILNQNTVKTLLGDLLRFYQDFNYGTVLSNLVALGQEDFEVARGGSAQIRGRDCFAVAVRRRKHPELRMYFDNETNLLQKVEFQGKFLDQNLRVADRATRVEFYFSDYRVSNGVNHWRKQEQHRDGAKYSEFTISEVLFFDRAEDSLFSVPEVDKEAQKIMAAQRQLDMHLENLQQALEKKDFTKASQAARSARLQQPNEPRLQKLELQLASLQDSVIKQNTADCEKLIQKGELGQARQLAKVTLTLAPDDARLQKLLAVAEKADAIAANIADVEKCLADKSFAKAERGLDNVIKAIREILDDALTASFAKQQVQHAKKLHQALLQEFIAAGNEALKRAEAASETKEFPKAIEQANAANESYLLVPKTLKASDPLLLGDNQAAEQGEKLTATANRLIRHAKGSLLRAAGLTKANDANNFLQQAKKSSRLLHKAKELFEAAATDLAAAGDLENATAKKECREVQDEILKVDKLIEPYLLDPERAETIKDWHADGWSTLQLTDGIGLRTLESGNILERGERRFPSEFTLSMDFSLVNQKGQAQNGFWKFYPSLLSIELFPEDRNQKNLRIVFGKSTDPRFQVSTVDINGKSQDFNQIEGFKDIIPLVLTKADKRFQLKIGPKEFTLPDGADRPSFNGLRILAKNGLDSKKASIYFPVVKRISVRVPELDAAASQP